MDEEFIKPKDFSGIVNVPVTCRHNGFPNYRIVSMKIEAGRVKEIVHTSDPYAYFEAVLRLEHLNETYFMRLKRDYSKDPNAKESFR